MDNKIKNALNHIKPNDEQKNRMLNNILEHQKHKRIRLTKYITIAASIIVVISSIFIKAYMDKIEFPPNIIEENSPPAIDKNLSKIEFRLSPGGMGYAGIMAFNRYELINKNPWSENMDIDRLPVFKNDLPTDFSQLENYIPRDKKDKLAQNIANALRIGKIKYEEKTNLYTDGNNISININPDLSASIFWDESIKLPYADIKNEYQRKLYYLEHYYKLYENLFNFEKPEFEVIYDYIYSGDKNYNHYVFDKNGSNQDKILNYSFNKARFGIEDGMFVLHLPSVYEYEKIGDYPIISKDEAISNILDGKYLTTVPYDEDIDMEDIAKIELEYYISPYCEYLQPVYTAYIELENDRQENGLITYGIYYTPAIEEEYVDIIIDEVFFN